MAMGGRGVLLLLLVFLVILGVALVYFKPQYALATLVGLGAFTVLFGLVALGKIQVSRR